MCASVTRMISSISARAQCVDRPIDQLRAVVERHDRDARRQARLQSRDLLLYRVDHVLRVDAVTRDDDAADRLLRAFYERGDPKGIADLHVGDVST